MIYAYEYIVYSPELDTLYTTYSLTKMNERQSYRMFNLTLGRNIVVVAVGLL